MNQTFDYHRFAMMFKLDFIEKGRTNLLMAALLIFALLVLMTPITFSNEFSPLREVLHYLALIMILLFGGSLFSSNAFSQYSNPSTGISALMIPASRLEKFLSSFLLNQIFVIFFVVFFWKLHYSLMDIANDSLITKTKYHYITSDIMTYATFLYFIIQAFVFLGSIYFQKASYIKTAVLFVVLGFCLVIANYMLVYRFTGDPDKVTAFPLSGWKLWYYGENGKPNPFNSIYYYITLPENEMILVQLLIGLMILLLWAAAYFQMKEREI